MQCRVVLLLFIGWLSLNTASQAAAQSNALDDSRQQLDEKFRQQFKQLAEQCATAGSGELAEQVRQWIVSRDPHRQYLFLPRTGGRAGSETNADLTRQFQQLRQEYAAQLMQGVEPTIAAQQPARAYRLLNEILIHDPDHLQARRALGFRRSPDDDSWLRTTQPVQARLSRRVDPLFQWEKGSFWTVETPLFEIHSAAGEQAGLELAQHAERVYWVWRQMFFEYWSSGRQLQQWLAGNGFDRSGSRRNKHEIYLFRDRDHYLNELRQAGVEGIEISTGYYNDRKRASFFYVESPAPLATWRHELVHQFFQENGSARKSPADEAHAWLVEGIAMLFESMRDHGPFVTVGGIDAERLQFARLRCKREGFFVPLEELDGLGLQELQRNPQVREVYSQSAGMSQFLMLGQQGKYQSAIVELTRLVYRGRSNAESLSELTGQPLSQLDRQYQAFLEIDRDAVRHHFRCDGQSGLALGRCNLTGPELVNIGACDSVQWIELSGNPIGDDALRELTAFPQLTQLFLDGTRITDEGLLHLTRLPHLMVVDLQNTQVTDAGIQRLRQSHPDLEILR